MADDVSKTTFEFDLDAKDVLEQIVGLKEAILGLGEKANLSGLIEGLTSVGELAAVLGAAYFALKTTFDMVFDAEAIQQVNQEFQTLADNIGIASDSLKSGLEEASHGLVGETDLLKAANRAMVEMGSNAEKLPEIMDLARNATAVMGGSVLDNFNAINQAIASGNARALRHLGIVVDQQKAYRDYAKELGVSADALSQAGKQAAIMNAALARGHEVFGEGVEDSRKATNAYQEFKIAMSEMGETIALLFNKTVGPAVADFFQSIRDGAKDVSGWIKSTFGEGQEAAEGRVERLKSQITQTQKAIEALQAPTKSWMDNFFPGNKAVALTKAKADLADFNAQLLKAEAELKKLQSQSGGSVSGPAVKAGAADNSDKVNEERRIQDELKTEQKLLEIHKQALQARKQLMTDEYQAQQVNAQEVVNVVRLAENQIAQIKAAQQRGDLTALKTGEAQIRAIELDKAAKIKAIEADLGKYEQQALNNRVKQNKDSAKAIVDAWHEQSTKAKNDLKDFGKLGQDTFQDLTQASVQMFEDIGKGQQSAGEIAKKFLFGFLGQRAIAEGTIMFMSGIWPPNPVALAGGGALIALGAFLESQSGGSDSSSMPTPPSSSDLGGSAGGVTDSSGGVDNSRPSVQTAQQQKAVSIHIQGNYFDTDQTRMALVQMVRDNQDATDYNVDKIGV